MVAAFRANGLGQILDFVPEPHGRRRRRQSAGGSTCWSGARIPSTPAGSTSTGTRTGAICSRSCWCRSWATSTARCWRRATSSSGSTPDTGSLAVWAYGTHKLPICPLHYQRVLGDEHPELERLGDAFSSLPDWRPRVAQRAKDLQARAGRACRATARTCAAAIEAAVGRLNGEPGQLETWRGLDALIQDQHWRAAHFRVAADDINYRRFFNINELAGLRMELPELFEHAHRLDLRAAARGRAGRPAHRPCRRAARSQGLSACGCASRRRGRSTSWSRRSWPGTRRCARTGRSRAPPATNSPIWCSGCWSIRRARTASPRPMRTSPASTAAVRARSCATCKIRIMVNEMASELNVLARDAARVARQNPRTADFTRNILQRALQRDRGLLSGLPHLRRRRRRADRAGPPRPRLGGGPGAAQRDRASIPASSTSCTGC